MALTILLTNDDGIHSPGLESLRKSMEMIGEVYVVAPDRERSAVGHSLTLDLPLRIIPVGNRTYAVTGTPTDCVALGVLKILGSRPDLIVAGINLGPNLGDDITYSGTVSAAMEGALLRIPSFAVSLAANENFQFDGAAKFSVRLAEIILERGLPPSAFINVNIPNIDLQQIRGVKITSLGRRHYSETVLEKVDPRGKPYYWFGGTNHNWEVRDGTDIQAISQNMISVTPLHLDLTHYQLAEEMKRWGIESELSKA